MIGKHAIHSQGLLPSSSGGIEQTLDDQALIKQAPQEEAVITDAGKTQPTEGQPRGAGEFNPLSKGQRSSAGFINHSEPLLQGPVFQRFSIVA